MTRLTQARIDEIYRIKCDGVDGRRMHPDYAAIKDAERRFIYEPLVHVIIKPTRHPDPLAPPLAAISHPDPTAQVGPSLRSALARPGLPDLAPPPAGVAAAEFDW